METDGGEGRARLESFVREIGWYAVEAWEAGQAMTLTPRYVAFTALASTAH